MAAGSLWSVSFAGLLVPLACQYIPPYIPQQPMLLQLGSGMPVPADISQQWAQIQSQYKDHLSGLHGGSRPQYNEQLLNSFKDVEKMFKQVYGDAFLPSQVAKRNMTMDSNDPDEDENAQSSGVGGPSAGAGAAGAGAGAGGAGQEGGSGGKSPCKGNTGVSTSNVAKGSAITDEPTIYTSPFRGGAVPKKTTQRKQAGAETWPKWTLETPRVVPTTRFGFSSPFYRMDLNPTLVQLDASSQATGAQTMLQQAAGGQGTMLSAVATAVPVGVPAAAPPTSDDPKVLPPTEEMGHPWRAGALYKNPDSEAKQRRMAEEAAAGTQALVQQEAKAIPQPEAPVGGHNWRAGLVYARPQEEPQALDRVSSKFIARPKEDTVRAGKYAFLGGMAPALPAPALPAFQAVMAEAPGPESPTPSQAKEMGTIPYGMMEPGLMNQVNPNYGPAMVRTQGKVGRYGAFKTKDGCKYKEATEGHKGKCSKFFNFNCQTANYKVPYTHPNYVDRYSFKYDKDSQSLGKSFRPYTAIIAPKAPAPSQ